MPFLHVRISKEVEEKIRLEADKLGYENVSQYIRAIIREEIDRFNVSRTDVAVVDSERCKYRDHSRTERDDFVLNVQPRMSKNDGVLEIRDNEDGMLLGWVIRRPYTK